MRIQQDESEMSAIVDVMTWDLYNQTGTSANHIDRFINIYDILTYVSVLVE